MIVKRPRGRSDAPASYRNSSNHRSARDESPRRSLFTAAARRTSARTHSQDNSIRSLEQELKTANERLQEADERNKVLTSKITQLTHDMLRKFHQIEEKQKRIEELEKDIQRSPKRRRLL